MPGTPGWRFATIFGSKLPRSETVTVEAFRKAVDEFAHVVLGRLDEANIHDTNLHVIWRHLERERENKAAAAFRRMEAKTDVASKA